MFKKLNKLYEAVFGDDKNTRDYPTLSSDEQARPLVDEVSTLKYQVKRQGKVIDALLKELGYEFDYEYSSLSNEERYVVVKKESAKISK